MTCASEVLGDWLERSLSNVPQELAVRIRAALPLGWCNARLSNGPAILTAAAAGELRKLLDSGCDSRSAAPGLLTVDALVTYACELLAYSGENIDAGSLEILNAIAQTLPHSAALA